MHTHKYTAGARALQRVYRGYRGRLRAAAQALRMAEMSALRSVLTHAAGTIQRVFRGYQVRVVYLYTYHVYMYIYIYIYIYMLLEWLK